jgi:HPt (histidine-containing phosphotransfer) domain-containing protein
MEEQTNRFASSLPIFDRAALLGRVDGDDALLGEVVEVFLDDAPKALHAVEGALSRTDLPALRAAAHALKGAAANISAEALRAAAGALEQLAHDGRQGEAAGGVREVQAALAALVPVLEGARHPEAVEPC